MLPKVIFSLSILAIFLCLPFLLTDNLKIPQKEILLPIDVSNRINICLPEDEE